MCYGCLIGVTGGTLPPVTEPMREAYRLVCEVYDTEWGSVGGPIHVQVDDMSVEGAHFTADARARVRPWFDRWARGPWTDTDVQLALSAFDALAALTEPERALVAYCAPGIPLDNPLHRARVQP